MAIPKRSQRQQGTHSVVDGIHFPMPIETSEASAFLAAFTIDAARAQALLPGQELHALKLWGDRGLLLVSVIDYRKTDIGKYIEFSVGIACSHGPRPAPRFLPMLFRRRYGMGQFVVELPVSTEVSVKGGKGIWGMPKHQGSLDFLVDDKRISSQYDLDGEFVMRVDVARPRGRLFPLTTSAVNYSHFRGMIMKSYVAFLGSPTFSFIRPKATLEIGDHPRVAALKDLDIGARPMATIFYDQFTGVLDDYMESWFVTEPAKPEVQVEGMESVINLGFSEEWPAPPRRLRP